MERPGHQLIIRAGEGDREAFAEFFDLTAPVALRLAQLRAPRHEEAEDIVAAAYRRAWESANEFSEAEISPLAWLLGLLHDSKT